MAVKEPSAKYIATPTSQDTVLGELPSDWQVGVLVDHAAIQSGIAKNANATFADPIEVPYLRVANVQDGYLDLTDISTIRVERSDLNRYAVVDGDVLMNEGGDLDKLGRGALWRGQVLPCVHQNHVFVVRCKPGLHPAYLNAWTQTVQARRYFLLAGRQTTNLASINKTSLGELTIALPASEAEQVEIATALADADTLIDSLEQLLTKQRQIKQGAMQELLTGKRRLPGFTSAWSLVPLGSIARITMGRTPSRRRPDFWGDGFKWLSIADLTGKVVSESKEEITQLAASDMEVVPAGTLLMSFKLTIGRLCFAGRDLYTNEAICAFRDPKADKEFLYYALGEVDFSLFGKQAVKGFTLNSQSLAAATVLLPDDPSEQHAIAQVLTDMDASLAALQARLTKARQLKQALMQVLLTGRIRLVAPSAAAASASAA